MTKNIPLRLRIDKKMDKDLDFASQKLDKTKSELVREAIKRLIKRINRS